MLNSLFHRHSSDVAFSSAKIVLTVGAALLLAGCGRKEEPVGGSVLRYEARGVVRGTSPDHKSVEIEHEDIPGFMPSMTMPFTARDQSEIATLKMGDAISFRLNVTQQDSWIDRVAKIDPAQLRLPKPGPAPSSAAASTTHARRHEGDAMPPFQLRDAEGKTVTLETFLGHPFVVTFIFTRCPIPNFCPRMSQNFAELQKAIQAATDAVAATRLLSISFDPAFDTPEVLKQYAQHTGADPAIWTFATGEPAEVQGLTKAFSILVQPEAGTISHSLATALVDRAGRIVKIWRGNGWTPAEVLGEVKAL